MTVSIEAVQAVLQACVGPAETAPDAGAINAAGLYILALEREGIVGLDRVSLTNSGGVWVKTKAKVGGRRVYAEFFNEGNGSGCLLMLNGHGGVSSCNIDHDQPSEIAVKHAVAFLLASDEVTAPAGSQPGDRGKDGGL